MAGFRFTVSSPLFSIERGFLKMAVFFADNEISEIYLFDNKQ